MDRRESRRAARVGEARARFLAVFAVVFVSASEANAQWIYWCEGSANRVSRARLDGTEVTPLVTSGLNTPDGLTIDPVSRKLYWAEQGGIIRRANLDGSDVEPLVVAGGVPDSVAIDPTSNLLCWTESGAARIRCADLDDGGNIRTAVSAFTNNAHGLALDPGAGKLYWANLGGSIRRANIDGTENELLVSSSLQPHGLKLDVENGKLYWADFNPPQILRSNLDGANVELVVANGPRPTALALDLPREKVYWTDLSDGRIREANLDGSDVQTLVSGLNLPLGIALELPGQGVPATSTWGLAAMALLLMSSASLIMRRSVSTMSSQ